MPSTVENRRTNFPELKVGVIIPCFNHGKYIEKAILSVVDQDYPHKAIFISDEGSTDNSFSIVTDLMIKRVEKDGWVIGEFKDVNIVIGKNPNPTGPSAARNRLMKLAWQSDLFSMLDADDYYLPGKISKSVNLIAENLEMIALVYTDADIYRENQNTFVREYREPYSRVRLEQECIISNTPLVNKKMLEKVGLYDETMRTAEDWDLWLRLTTQGVAIHIPEALHVYRVTGKNASDTVSKEIWNANWKKIQERINASH